MWSDRIDRRVRQQLEQNDYSRGIDVGELFPLASADADVEIEDGHHRYWELFFAEDASPDVESVEFSCTAIVREGPAVDLILLPREEFEHFRDGQTAEYYAGASRLDTEYADASGRLAVADYVLVVDNTRYGDADGVGTATVSAGMTAEEV